LATGEQISVDFEGLKKALL